MAARNLRCSIRSGVPPRAKCAARWPRGLSRPTLARRFPSVLRSQGFFSVAGCGCDFFSGPADERKARSWCCCRINFVRTPPRPLGPATTYLTRTASTPCWVAPARLLSSGTGSRRRSSCRPRQAGQPPPARPQPRVARGAAISGGTVASLSRARRPKAADCPAPAGRPPARVGGPCAWALERMLLLLLGGGYSCS